MLTFSALTFKEALAGDSITVSVEVEGFRNENGLCRLLLYENENGFPDSPEDAKLMLSRKVEGKILDFIFNIIPGRYALVVLHDENSNKKMDKTWYGKPKEGFGTSNNPKINFSPPGFEESAIEIDKKNNYIKIKIKYL
jgi:uncharacterized protein (DUF2141 family)